MGRWATLTGVGVVAAFAQPALSLVIQWGNASSANSSWTLHTSWQGGTQPGVGDVAAFTTGAAIAVQPSLISARSVSGVSVHYSVGYAGGTGWQFNGNTNGVLSIGTGGVTMGGTAALTAPAVAGSTTYVTTVNTMNWQLATSQTWTINNSTSTRWPFLQLNVNTPVTEAAGSVSSLTKSGTGALQLKAANTWTGATHITGGTLWLGTAAGSIASTAGINVRGGATLRLDNSGTASGINNNNRISGNVTLDGGQVWLQGNDSTSAPTNTAEEIDVLSLAGGQNAIALTAGAGNNQRATLSASAMHRADAGRATLLVRSNSFANLGAVSNGGTGLVLGGASAGGFSLDGLRGTTALVGASGAGSKSLRVIPWAVGAGGTTPAGNHPSAFTASHGDTWLTYDAGADGAIGGVDDRGFRMLDPASEYEPSLVAGANVRLAAAAASAGHVGRAVNSLILHNQRTDGSQVAFSGTGTLSITGGALMNSGHVAASSAASARNTSIGGFDAIDFGVGDAFVHVTAASLDTSSPSGMQLTPGVLTIASPVTAGGALVKSGPGSLFLTQPVTLGEPAVAVNAGTLVLAAAGALPAAAAVDLYEGAMLDLRGLDHTLASVAGAGTIRNSLATPVTLTLTGAGEPALMPSIVDGSGPVSLRKTGADTWTLGAASTFSGPLQIDGGVAQLAGDGRLAATVPIVLGNVAGAAFDLNGFDQTIGSLSGGGAAGGNVLLGAGQLTVNQSTNTAFGGVISGATGSIIKSGTGALTLAGHNTFGGGTKLEGGTLAIAHSSALGTGPLVVNAVATVRSDLPDATGPLVDVQLIGTSTLTFSGSGPLSFAGLALRVGDRTVTVNNPQVRFTSIAPDATATRSLTKVGPGTLVVDGNVTYTGATYITGGTFAVGGSMMAGAGAISLSGGGVFARSGNWSPTLGAGNNQLNWTSSGDGGLAAYGMAEGWGGANDLVVNANSGGTLTWNAGNFVQAARKLVLGSGVANGTVTLQNAISLASGSREIYVHRADAAPENGIDARLAGPMSAGMLVKTGPGVLELGAGSNYSSGTTVKAGTLLVSNSSGSGTGNGGVLVEASATLGGGGSISGATTVQGTLAPGNSAGRLTINNAVTLAAGATFEAEIGGTTPAGGHDQLAINNTTGTGLTIDAGANLQLSLLNGYIPSAGDYFVVVNNDGADPVSGVFAKVNGATMPLHDGATFTVGVVGWRIDYDANPAGETFGGNDVMLTAITVPEPAAASLVAATMVAGLARRRRRSSIKLSSASD